MSWFVLPYFNIQACRLFCRSSSLQSRSLSYVKKTARNVLTPDDTCLTKKTGICLCWSLALLVSERNGQPTLFPQYPMGSPRGLSFPAASGSAPLIALERYQDGGIRVACRSAGWYPQPQVLWQDPHGRHLPSLSEKVTQDKSGLFAAESSIILTRGTNQKLSCSVRHVLHSQEQGSAFYISGEQRTRASSC